MSGLIGERGSRGETTFPTHDACAEPRRAPGNAGRTRPRECSVHPGRNIAEGVIRKPDCAFGRPDRPHGPRRREVSE